jgi:predicted aldo/keto reductase-like oxidoreductase
VSEVGFGGIPIVSLGVADAVAVVRHAFQQGITFYDTARMYRDSEQKIGQGLESVRARVILATKTLSREREKAARDIESSLNNLRTNYLDLYQLHNVSDENALQRVCAPGGALEALEEARAAGKVRHVGVTSHNIETAAEACRSGRFETLQFPFNFIEREAEERLFQTARERGMGIIAMKPLGGGMLESARLCFGFLQQFRDVVPIPGIAKAAEVDEIVGLYRSPVELGEADLAAMERIHTELGPRFCHRCEYCMPCEQGVQIPFALGFHTFVKRFGRVAAVHVARIAMERAADCTECGDCLARCPYGLPIPELLRENLTLFRECERCLE